MLYGKIAIMIRTKINGEKKNIRSSALIFCEGVSKVGSEQFVISIEKKWGNSPVEYKSMIARRK